jgi:hypothetical protein
MTQVTSFRLSISKTKSAGGRFIAHVRRELQKALVEEHAASGMTQADIARTLGVNRSVIHRQILGVENMTLVRVGEISGALGRVPRFFLDKPAQAKEGSNEIVTKTNQPPLITLEELEGA